ncbi:phospho-N-acetylmuramoyl-pentapeptide-transferase [bacterium BMS3Abin15]|nr:phospho-N-acetylmuramoyl-pentapeptide-transferase [bacterium BMS3Abin15]HDH07497.1 phospho-N-acetylmuramoyl-pentapeptide-transferase [Candidatus Moranbacteria bacterium]HDZ84936.1 phospho-N-acetylmuramoyl-pentapeptide-transferase [Candidatus Moranbacteria bacterium]
MEIAQIQTIPMVINVMKVLVTGAIAFFLAFLITPFWTNVLYRFKIGIKIKEKSYDGDKLTFVNKLHARKAGTPTMGGVIIWVSVLILVFASHYLFPIFARWTDINFIARLDFLSRSQVWLPLFALVTAGVLGLFDDIMSIRGWGSNKGGGMKFAMRFWWLFAIAGVGAWWFFSKLGWDQIHIPAVGDFSIGFWYVPLFVFVIFFTAFSSNETDGLDGLNGGVLLMAFASFTIIAFLQNKVDMAAFCAAISGTLLAFLWFNIYPARFFMGDTGAMALGTTLGVVAMLTNSVLVLFVIMAIYILESGSAAVQLLSKKYRGKKIFLAAPIHHHFEAKGWPEPKIVMRAWIFTSVTALIGVIIGILGMGK